ncbi:MAG: hypothetical protein ABI183_04925 [Polyangiaceae bacterium]
MDPFRADLAAAHEKIARLEEEVRELRHENDPPPAVPARRPQLPVAIDPEHQRQTRIMFWFVGGFSIVFLLILGAIIVALSQATPPR